MFSKKSAWKKFKLGYLAYLCGIHLGHMGVIYFFCIVWRKYYVCTFVGYFAF